MHCGPADGQASSPLSNELGFPEVTQGTRSIRPFCRVRREPAAESCILTSSLVVSCGQETKTSHIDLNRSLG